MGTGKARVRRIVVVSDLHVGSELALCPPDFDPDPNMCRRLLWLWWGQFTAHVREWAGREPFVLVVNGDATEGLHHGRDQLLIRSLVRQFRAAREALAPLVKLADCTYFIEGTHCHVLDDEAEIAEDLRGMKVRSGPGGTWAWPRLKLTMAGKVHSFRHHIGTTSRPWLESSALSIELAASRLQSLNAGEPPTDVMIASHRHLPGMVRSSSGLAIVTPSWQFPTRHVFKVVPEARPVVGAALLDYTQAQPGAFPNVEIWERRPAPDQGTTHD